MNFDSYELRPATAVDQPAIKQLIRQVNINPLGIKWQRFWVVMDGDGRLLACGQLKPHRDGSCELASIAVQPDWRKRGLARLLIEHLLDGRSEPVWLTCVSKLIPFYEPFGFVAVTAVATMPPYFRRAQRFFRLYQKVSRFPHPLAVMVRA